MMTQSTNQWGLFPWFREHGTDVIHPDDIEGFIALIPNGKVFESFGVDGKYMILAYGNKRFRVKPELFREVARPPKQIGDTVVIKEKGQQASGVIVEIHWHHQRNEPFYIIEKDGKRSTKRYWSSDFQ